MRNCCTDGDGIDYENGQGLYTASNRRKGEEEVYRTSLGKFNDIKLSQQTLVVHVETWKVLLAF